MKTRITFQTRARTIDHLGRGQIADCPTAVSELWKNAYDAYAKNVELQIFDGEPKVAGIFDDGFGMTKDDFLERWLVIGTESKIDNASIPKTDRFGAGERPRQGEKGIGRLSAAFLAPVNLIVSKKKDHAFAAAIVDWRLFENPFLSLEDIGLPVEEFERPEQLLGLLPKMLAVIAENTTGENGPQERRSRLREGWKRFNVYETEQGIEENTSERILKFSKIIPISQRHLTEWPVFLELETHGTALFMLDVHRELAVWVDNSIPETDDEVLRVKTDLRRTLTGFTDPYAENRIEFNYTVRINIGDKHIPVLSSGDIFGSEELKNLEHVLEGKFDDKGVFKGRLRAFGKDRGECTFVPSRIPPQKGIDRLGGFSFCIGSFEQNAQSSTHDAEVHAHLEQAAEKYSGLAVYRDGLRVMPYGRPEADFFGMEERRTKNAGREFWVHRRCFGRVAFTRESNPNLRDKAGREGLVDNRARRELRLLVENVLMESARRYFGSASDIREGELPEIQRRNAAAKESAERARKNRRQGFRKSLRENKDKLFSVLEDATLFKTELKQKLADDDGTTFALLSEKLDKLFVQKEDLRLPPLPAKLGEDEESYRVYRNAYREFSALLDSLGKKVAEQSERLPHQKPREVLKTHLNANQARISDKLRKHLKAIRDNLEELKRTWTRRAEEDGSRYYEKSNPLLDDLEKGTRLSTLLNLLDAYYQELDQELDCKYEPFIRALQQLLENIDLDSALTITEDERSALEEKLSHFHALAQMGISIEIIGHELNTLDSEVGRNLKRLPDEVQRLEAFKLAFEAHKALVDRLRFLSPLKLAGYRARQKITGDEIAKYTESFFVRQFKHGRVSFTCTPAFRNIEIADLPSRIFPAFINLVNNSLYWLNLATTRKLVFDRVGEKVIIADSGPGVDPDDVEHLFELFFTRRSQGRGVGLYLTRVNLAAAHHKIRYGEKHDPKVLSGANFIIEFKGLKHD
jgi:signal transduction histidine kinase